MNTETTSPPSRAGFCRRLCCRLFTWRTIRRALIALACAATLVAVLYTEENVRGKRAWEKCRRDLEANGAVFDWSAYIAPPVPDDQNFFKAPGINESDWSGRGPRALSSRLGAVWPRNSNSMVVAELTLVTSDPAPNAGTDDTVLRLNDSTVRTRAEQLIRGALGPSLPAVREFHPFVTKPTDDLKRASAIVVSDTTPSAKEILAAFPERIDGSRVQVQPSGSNSFQVLLNPAPVFAGDHLRLSDPLEAEFDVIREALKRPCTRMDGDYSEPATIPIPNFITLRTVVQFLAERTKCHLLLGQPDQALRDVTLLEDICRIAEAKPTGKPMTLVASMVNVAITGLYADTIADGLRLQAWREPQLVALQEQLARVNLAPLVDESFHEERVYAVRTMERMSRSELAQMFTDENASFSERLTDFRYLFIMLAPRGWFYQNMVVHTEGMKPICETYDSTNGLILPGKTAMAQQLVNNVRMSPYSFLNLVFLPNFTRAWQVVARNQTMANEALIACALERHRMAHKDYPATLDALVPRFIAKIPHDLIGGQPLKYRRTADGKFALYSIAWNETDDGGQAVLNSDGSQSLDKGDWVWRQ